jgi:hypothetical protein
VRPGRVSVVPVMAVAVPSINLDAAAHRLDAQHYPHLRSLVFAVTRTSLVASQLGYAVGIRIGGGDRRHGFMVPAYQTGSAPLLNGQGRMRQTLAPHDCRILSLHHRRTTFEEEFRTLLNKTAWHSMNDIYRTDSLAAPFLLRPTFRNYGGQAGQVVIGNGYQGLEPLAESCHPLGMSPTRSSRSDRYLRPIASPGHSQKITKAELALDRMYATNSEL